MASITLEMDVPDGIDVRGYERIDAGHAFEVAWALPEAITCSACQTRQTVVPQTKGHSFYVIRDLELWGQPSFFVYQAPFHQCQRCGRRQEIPPPFKRPHVTYTYRFEEHVLCLLIGSSEEEVARRLGISAEMVATIVKHRLQQEQQIDPQRRITDVGLDEISLKKGHKLYVTILTDLSDPAQPRVLAVREGRDQRAAEVCLGYLSAQQRQAVKSHRIDMSPAYGAACAAGLPHSQEVIDRFHVAKKLGEVVDRVRKKSHGPTRRA